VKETLNLTPVRRGNLTPSKHSIWPMFNSEVYTFNCRIIRGAILIRRRGIRLSDYSISLQIGSRFKSDGVGLVCPVILVIPRL
jgi:hypothetical protein